MRFVFHIFMMAAIALGVGFGLSYYTLTDGRLFGAQQTGPWRAWPEIGAPNPDPYTRAFLSRSGHMPLGRSEGIQFSALSDSDGQKLDPNCTYLVDGKTPLAAFWTLVAIDETGINTAKAGTPIYIDSSHIARASDGSMSVRVGPELAAGNWLQTNGTTEYSLLLTLYDSSVFSGLGSEISEIPTIVRESC